MLAKTTVGDHTKHLASMDISVARNAYGRQLGSFVTNADFKGIGEIPMWSLFVDQSLKPLDQKLKFYLRSREPSLAAKEKNMLVTSFHPGLTGDTRVHAYFSRDGGSGQTRQTIMLNSSYDYSSTQKSRTYALDLGDYEKEKF